MSSTNNDRELGMSRRITRRDFLDGVALSAAALAAGCSGGAPAEYPPALTGLRGQYAGSYSVAHSLRDGTFWNTAATPEPTGEHYDLVVVGGGISGLAAAHFYQQRAGNDARILILETLDDFGGHAKRNEFNVRGRVLLSNAGTQSIESPGEYSAVAKGLLHDLGIDVQRFYRYYDQSFFSSRRLRSGVFFDRATFGADRLVVGFHDRPYAEFFAEAPLSDTARRDLVRIYTEQRDYLPGLTVEEKRAKLAKTSYADFLTNIAGLEPDVLPFFQQKPHDLFGVGIDAVSALDCFEAGDDYDSGYPGFLGLGIGDADPRESGREEPYIFHFPDGNASIARLLVRKLIPGSIPGSTMEDVVTARADYSTLDRAGSAVRIRLKSSVVRTRHTKDNRAVEIAYVNGGRLETVTANHCVLACWNVMVPYLAPDLPKEQREALKYNVKVPLVYTHVALRNWTAFSKLGVHQIISPGGYHNFTMLDFPVSLGSYAYARSPDDPMVLFMLRTPCHPGLPAREQQRLGRMELYQTPFSTFERNIRDELGRMLSPGGFDPARDITAITVNRWAHGYAYQYLSLWDPQWPPGKAPNEIGRKPFGRITIANSDSAALAYSNAAIDEAHRAVEELLL